MNNKTNIKAKTVELRENVDLEDLAIGDFIQVPLEKIPKELVLVIDEGRVISVAKCEDKCYIMTRCLFDYQLESHEDVLNCEELPKGSDDHKQFVNAYNFNLGFLE